MECESHYARSRQSDQPPSTQLVTEKSDLVATETPLAINRYILSVRRAAAPIAPSM